MNIYLEFVEGSSRKFWSVRVEGANHTVRYGRIGSAGQSKESSFESEEAALADAEKQAAKKRKKGYADAAPSDTAPAQKAPKKKKKAPKKAKAPSVRTINSLFKAMREGNVDKVAAELDRAFDPSFVFDIQEDGDPWSLLYHAVFHRSVEVANLLLDRGADGAFRCKDGAGPLFHVSDADLCKRLIEAGADPALSNSHGSTPLHRAGSVQIARALLDAGADVDAEDGQGRTPYEMTTDVALRDLLMERGARGLKTTDGEAFDMVASEVGFEDVDAQRGTVGVAHDGALWFGGYSGLFRVAEGKAVRYATGGANPAVGGIASAHGVVYISTNWGLLAFDGEGFRIYNHSNSPLHDQHITEMAVVDDEVYCVGYESEAESKHISAFDGKKWRLLRPGQDLPDECDTRCIMRDAGGRLLLSDDEGGGVYALEDGAWSYDNFGKKHFTPKVYVMGSHDGVDYFGTHAGLWRREKGELREIADGAVGQLAWIGDTLWAATNWDGVYAIRDGAVEHYTSERAGVDLGNVEAMAATNDGVLYILTGRFLYQVKDGVFSVVEKPVDEQTVATAPEPKLPVREDSFVTDDALPAAWVAAARESRIEGLDEGALIRLAQPAIGVAVEEGKAARGASKLGGLPDLPKGAKWPKGEEDDDHLPFILQLNCAELAPFDVQGLLPKKGHLYLFSDTSAEDEEGSKLLYATGAVAPRALPDDLGQRSAVDDFVATIDEKPLRFFTQYTLPSLEWLSARGELSDEDEDAIRALRDALMGATEWSSTQVLGWPSPVQGELLGGDESVALLQLDALGDFGNWLVDGLRYWIIDRESLAKKRWEEIWSEYQYT